jgi:iron(III) transport system permease protein
MASALSVVIVFCSLAILLLQKFWIRAEKLRHDRMRRRRRVKLRGWRRFLASLPIYLVTAVALLRRWWSSSCPSWNAASPAS